MAEIIYRKLSELTLLEGNPRRIHDEDFERLCQSVKENPDYFEARPLILSDRTGKYVIIAGNMRFRAAQSIGLEMVPTILLAGLTAKKEKEIIIRDNVSNGVWDFDILANEFEIPDLTDWGIDLSQFDASIPSGGEPKKRGKKVITCPHCGNEIE